MADDLEEKWKRLTSWLITQHPGFETNVVWKEVPGAGRGLFMARAIKPGGTLLEIPASALLNPLTLTGKSNIPSHLFPESIARDHNTRTKRPRLNQASLLVEGDNLRSPRLNTTQLLTLHLLLSRDPEGRHPSPWSVYIDTLPASFRRWHPLTWVVRTDQDLEELGDWWRSLIDGMSRGTRRKLEEVRGRYEEDYKVLRGVLASEEPFVFQNLNETLRMDDYLWAWLNINTRTVSIPLNLPTPTHLYNHTLVPILDFANHSSYPKHIIPRPLQIPSSLPSSSSALPLPIATGRPGGRNIRRIGGRSEPHLIPGRIGFRLIAPDFGMAEEQEVMFEYGAHSNAVLFAEYGFCEVPADKQSTGAESGDGMDDRLRHSYGEVDVGWIVDELWDKMRLADGDEDELWREKEDVLRSISCWRQNTIHPNPLPPYPSHALLMTLRILHLPASQKIKLNPIKTGTMTYTSPNNEKLVIFSLIDIAERVKRDVDEGLKRLKALGKDLDEPNKKDVADGIEARQDALKSLGYLLREEKEIVVGFLEELGKDPKYD